MKQAYPIILTPDKDGYCVYVPDMDINTSGTDVANAIFMAEDAISLCGITYQDMGREIPAPSPTLPQCAEHDIPTFAVVDFEEYRRANDMRSIRKNVTIPSYLNDLAQKAGLSFSQVLQDGLRARLGVQ